MQLLSFNVTGTGATLQISAVTPKINKCKWFQFLSLTGVLNIGGVDTDSSHGYPIGTQSANFQPPIALAMDLYDLSAIYFYMGNTDTAVLLCAI